MKRSTRKAKIRNNRQKFAADKDERYERLEKRLTKEHPALADFDQVWRALMTTPIHLDSALSKLTPKKKSILAQIIPRILAQPASLAEHYGIGTKEGAPWSLSTVEKANWRPARLIAEQMIARLDQGLTTPPATEADFPPEWIEEWQKEWGKNATHHLAETLALPPPLGMRLTRSLERKEAVQELSQKEQIPVKVTPSEISPVGIRLASYARVMQTALFLEGKLEIQDEGSQVMALFALDPKSALSQLTKLPNEPKRSEVTTLPKIPPLTVIDACAGAGGKTLALADLLANKGRVYSYDIFQSKVDALKRRAQKAGLTNVQGRKITEGKELEEIEKFKKTADVVLVDAPCSGLGVLKRNPDIKWRTKPSSLSDLPTLQTRLLDIYSELVKPGGRLVYGTCTFRKEETLEIVEKFGAAHSNWKPMGGGYLGPGSTDGFYMFAWERKE